jgi:SAM-dependent methyltransferase
MSSYPVDPAKGVRSGLKYIYYPASWDLAKYTFASTFVDGKGYVLDVGCSDGYGSSILSNAGARKVTGGDIEPKAIEYAKNHYDHEGLDFICLDATVLPFPSDSVDVIVALEIIEHLPEEEQRRFLPECRRVLKDGGLIICSTPNKQVYTPTNIDRLLNLNPSHIKEFYIAEFHDLLNEYFADVTLFGQWFMNSNETIAHKTFLTACLILEKFVSLLSKETRIGSFIYRVIISVVISDKQFKVSPLADNPSRQPLDIIAAARAVKKEVKPGV